MHRSKTFHTMSLPPGTTLEEVTLELKEKETWVQTQVLWIQMPITSSIPSKPSKLLECVWMADGKAAGAFL